MELRGSSMQSGEGSTGSHSLQSAPPAGEPGVRAAVVGRIPYLIFYTIEENEVIILHARNARP